MPVYHHTYPSHLRSFTPLRSTKRQYLIQPTDSPTTATGRNVLYHVTFNSLPIELQDEIFFLCLSPFPRFSIKEAPIVLAQVCSTWRSIVLSTPRLWSSFEAEIQGLGASGLLHDTRLLYRMKSWLGRSSCCPLSIRLVYDPVGLVSFDRSARLLGVLVPEARRWRNAHFALPPVSIAMLQHFPPNSFPTLRSLTLKVTRVRSSPSDPLLNISSMNIPWHQLTSLDLQLESNNLPTLDEGLNILSKTINLKHGTLQLECTRDRHDIRWDKLSLPTLETLHLIFQGVSTAGDRPEVSLVQFLNAICSLKLRVLRLEWLVDSNTGPLSLAHADFLAFLQASAETLRELTMTYFPISENELLECLSHVPWLTHLSLRFALNEGANDPITNRLLVACTIPSSSVSAGVACTTQAHAEAPLLPRLEHINLQSRGGLYANTTLLTLIQSRWETDNNSVGQSGRRPLKYFRVLSMKAVPLEVVKYVEACRKEGLEIDIQCLVVR